MAERFYQAFNMPLSAASGDLLSKVAAARDAFTALTAVLDEHDQQALGSYDKAFLARFTCNSAAIEGSTLTELETQLVLDGEFVPTDNKELSDMFAVKGVAEGYQYALAQARNGRVIDEDFIKDIHERTALDCQPRTRGAYRQSAAMIAGSPVVVSAPHQIPVDMGDLIYAYDHSPLPDLAKAVVFHALFENIHPFIDGNGRTGRTLLNVMLDKVGYPPVALKSADRRAYLESLQYAQINGDYEPLLRFVAREIHAEIDGRTHMIDLTRRHTRE
ncbi:MAG: Fic family protein [Actinomycetaceae bacterium]|nr:Fic family protein [Actinomycetaceae bacterium]